MRRPFRYESRREAMLSRQRFVHRLLVHIALAGVLIGVSLAAGMAGYAYFESMEWIDAFANASMILSGMGPLASPQTPGGKIFAGCYALYSGLVLILATGFILTPVAHRVLHRFHMEAE